MKKQKVHVIDKFELTGMSLTSAGIELDGVVTKSRFEDAPSESNLQATTNYTGSCNLSMPVTLDTAQLKGKEFRILDYYWEGNVPCMLVEEIETGQKITLCNCYPTSYTTTEKEEEVPNGIKIQYLKLEYEELGIDNE